MSKKHYFGYPKSHDSTSENGVYKNSDSDPNLLLQLHVYEQIYKRFTTDFSMNLVKIDNKGYMGTEIKEPQVHNKEKDLFH